MELSEDELGRFHGEPTDEDRRTERGIHSLDTQRERPKLRPRVTHLQKGTAIGRYVVLEILGRGGMGVVYSAYDPELDRRVAIKLLKARGNSSRDQAWLLREAQALARLAHPNVVAVHDVGMLPEDRVFIAMEHVEGETLRHWLHGRKRAWQDSLPILIAAGTGLAAAHDAGLVHRDFKPENVIVGADRVRVMDFGLARLQDDVTPGSRESGDLDDLDIDPRNPLGESLTKAGTVMGTPAYMGPELLLGRPADPRSDQFAFGMTAFEALYGIRPFTAEELALVEVNIAPQPKEPPKAGVPPHVHEAVMRAIALDPEARFPSMHELLAALQPPVRRKRGWVIASTALSAAAAAAITFAATSPEREEVDPCAGGEARVAAVWDGGVRERITAAFVATGRGHARETAGRVGDVLDAYTADWVAERRRVCEATEVRREQSALAFDARMQCLGQALDLVRAMTELFGTADGALVDTAMSTARELPAVTECATLAADDKPRPTPAQAQQLEQFDRDFAGFKVATMAGRFQHALDLAPPLLARARQIDYAPTTVTTMFLTAVAQMGAAKHADAERTLRDTLELAAIAQDDLMLAQLWTYLIFTVGQQPSRFAEVEQLHATAKIAVKRAGRGAWLEGDLAYNLGTAYLANNKTALAVKAYEDAIELRSQALGTREAELWKLHNGLGGAYLKAGNVFGAKQAFEKALEITERANDPTSPNMTHTLSNLAALALAMADWDHALAIYRRALRIAELTDGPEHERTAVLLYNMGVAKNGLEKYAEAIPYYERALRIFERDRSDYYLALTLAGLADCREEAGDAARAAGEAERGLELMLKGNDPVQIAYARYVLAKALWSANRDRTRARELGREARKGFQAGGLPALNGLVAVDRWLAETR